jgi:hypothetical protein
MCSGAKPPAFFIIFKLYFRERGWELSPSVDGTLTIQPGVYCSTERSITGLLSILIQP